VHLCNPHAEYPELDEQLITTNNAHEDGHQVESLDVIVEARIDFLVIAKGPVL
jgi:hypothetical protein